MKKILFIIAVSMLLLACESSTKSEYTNSDGVIIGFDARKCMCCGGWFVEMDHDTMRTWIMPAEFDNLLREKELPVEVNFDWKNYNGSCGGDDLIEINAIKFR